MLENRYVTAEAAVAIVKSGDRVFIHGSAATPAVLLKALLARKGDISNVELTAISTFGEMDWKADGVADSFYMNSLFVSENVREWVNSERGDYVPVFLSEISKLFEEGYLPLDVAMLHVSPPDEHGFCSLGVSADIALSAARSARRVIAQVNPRMPRVLGDGFLHLSKFDACVWVDEPLPEVNYSLKRDDRASAIGRLVAGEIEDGATLQMGIGAIPDAVLSCLTGHKGLGVHTEMFSDGVVDLYEKGIITNEHKKIERGKIISTFVVGTRRLYDFVHDNRVVNLMEVSYVNHVGVISQNPKVVAINSAIEIDITGQVCADSIGTRQYSGIGGQMDFIRGAALSHGGKPIIALPSVTSSGISRIVPHLKEGAGVVTSRGHIHYVATEFGIVNLFGKNMEQRAKMLIEIAHPDHRDSLERAFHDRFGRSPAAISRRS